MVPFVVYRFVPGIERAEISALMESAIRSAESLFGETAVRLEAIHHLGETESTAVICLASEVGRALSRLFTGGAIAAFGEDRFAIQRVMQDLETSDLAEGI